MKIKSKTDIITNSSTEVYNKITEKNVEKLKELINALLDFTGYGKTCDEILDIKLVPMDEEDAWENRGDIGKGDDTRGWDELGEEEKIKYLLEYAEDCSDNAWAYPELSITPKEGVDIPWDTLRVLTDVGVLLGDTVAVWG